MKIKMRDRSVINVRVIKVFKTMGIKLGVHRSVTDWEDVIVYGDTYNVSDYKTGLAVINKASTVEFAILEAKKKLKDCGIRKYNKAVKEAGLI